MLRFFMGRRFGADAPAAPEADLWARARYLDGELLRRNGAPPHAFGENDRLIRRGR
jgi:hypothetical protein